MGTLLCTAGLQIESLMPVSRGGGGAGPGPLQPTHYPSLLCAGFTQCASLGWFIVTCFSHNACTVQNTNHSASRNMWTVTPFCVHQHSGVLWSPGGTICHTRLCCPIFGAVAWHTTSGHKTYTSSIYKAVRILARPHDLRSCVFRPRLSG